MKNDRWFTDNSCGFHCNIYGITGLQIYAFESLRNTILCNCVLLLTAITLVFDGISKDIKK